jgi:hypothetical protein
MPERFGRCARAIWWLLRISVREHHGRKNVGQLIPYDRMSPRTVPWDVGQQLAQAESERCWTGDGNDAAAISSGWDRPRN